jgi:hypothetical protein
MTAPLTERLEKVVDGFVLGPKVAEEVARVPRKNNVLLRDELVNRGMPLSTVFLGNRHGLIQVYLRPRRLKSSRQPRSRKFDVNSGRPARAVWKAYAVRASTAANAKMVLPAYQVEKLVLSGKAIRRK